MDLPDRDPLVQDLIYTSSIGRTSGRKILKFEDLSEKDGITRPTGSKADKEMRDYVVKLMKELDLEVNVDKVGNIFGLWKGQSKETIMVGSHIDSVINGGHFDGALGVLSAIDVIRKLKNEKFKNKKSIEVVAFTGEEGSSFPVVCLGSKVLTGELSLEEAYNLKNKEGKTLIEILEDIEYKGTYIKNLQNVIYFIELHIEQGPVLYDKKFDIGVVDRISGVAWIQTKLYGKQAHAGTFPMNKRIDPTIAAADIISYVNRNVNELIVVENRDSIKGTVGKISSYPGLPNVIPAYIELGIDIRDTRKETFENLINTIHRYILDTEKRYKIKSEVLISKFNDPIELSSDIRSIIEEESQKMGYKTMHIDSGATHDAAVMASKVKTGMIFVPSKDGISHSPLEWTDFENCKKGAYILKKVVEKLGGM
ncbi:MAG: M20 family metallo-hydrolase [Caldisphaera sp.]